MRHILLLIFGFSNGNVCAAPDQDGTSNKKKNRRKKDLPTLGTFNGIVKSKSKPIPNG